LCILQSLLRMRSITWPVHRGPPKPHVAIFWPRIVYPLYNFYGATMSIKGTFILEHPHVKAIFGRIKTVQSKSVPKIAVFRKFKGLNIKYSYRDPKRHFLTRNDVFWRILRKNPFKGVGALLKSPKNEEKTSHPKCTAKSRIWGAETPEPIASKFHVGCRPGCNHACQFWWRSVKGIWCGGGSNFGLFYWLASSPLKHSRTTVRVCDLDFLNANTFCSDITSN